MTRGTFANIRLKNLLAPGTEGGVTRYLGKPRRENLEEITSIFDASDAISKATHPAGGFSPARITAWGFEPQDWAAKGVYLLGVKAAIAESFERIHRSNLVGMGVLPLQYMNGQNRESLGLIGTETFEILVGDDLKPLQGHQGSCRDARQGRHRVHRALSNRYACGN